MLRCFIDERVAFFVVKLCSFSSFLRLSPRPLATGRKEVRREGPSASCDSTGTSWWIFFFYFSLSLYFLSSCIAGVVGVSCFRLCGAAHSTQTVSTSRESPCVRVSRLLLLSLWLSFLLSLRTLKRVLLPWLLHRGPRSWYFRSTARDCASTPHSTQWLAACVRLNV